MRTAYKADGSPYYGKYCATCHGAVYKGQKSYILHKKGLCELCGFVPVNKCQLDVDHIDGNKSNNSAENLQTLCANCHRLKTFLNSDWEDRETRELKSMQLTLHI